MSADLQRDLLKDALLKIRHLKGQLEARERARTEPIAIVGIGCRFPGGADTPDAYWRLLRDGVDAIADVPADRWNVEAYYDADPDAPGKSYLRRGGFLGDLTGFDADFFGIAPREAVRLDPQQRLLLEVSWEALEHAGLVPERLGDRTTGVYVGAMGIDYAFRQAHQLHPGDIDPYMLTGNDLSFAAGRLAYVLGLHGPAMVISTACSSSLVSVHLAAQALRAGECDLALAGGVNLVLDPTTNVMLAKLRAIARDGRCKTFDADADGYGRGEGCGIVVLERLSDAVARGRRILATVRGSAVNHDGPSAGLTVPNGRAQEALLRRACAAAGVEPGEVGYVEAHGTGTPLGDPIEVHALASVMGASRTRPLLVGSVKTNIGHLEAAAGIAGLIKTVLALQHRELPPHLNCRTPNPHVRWDEVPVRIVQERTAWEPVGGRRVAGISSFGLSGVNAHIVVEEAPGVEAANTIARTSGAARLLPISARTAPALAAQAARYASVLSEGPEPSLGDVCATAGAGRTHFAHRAFVIAGSGAEAARLLRDTAPRFSKAAPRVAFLFPSEGSLAADLDRTAFDSLPPVRRVLDECDRILETRGLPARAGSPALDMFAIEAALAGLWQAWGIEPVAVAGEGVGEIVANTIAGVWSLEDGLSLAAGVTPQAGPAQPRVPVVAAHDADRCLTTLVGAGADTFVEVGVGRPIIGRLSTCAAARHDATEHGWLSSVEPGREWRGLLESLGELYCRGAAVNWEAFEHGQPGERRIVTLPTYPFQRERFWALDDQPDVQQAPSAPNAPAIAVNDHRQRVMSAPEAQRPALVMDAFAGEVRSVLGRRPDAPVDAEVSPIDLGLDSLMSLELHTRIKTAFGVDVPVSRLLSDATFGELAKFVAAACEGEGIGGDESEVASGTTAPDTDALPLSYGQKALWFIHQGHPESPAYNVGVALRVRGAVDVQALERACQALVDRHPALRTIFTLAGDEPRQRVLDRQDVCFAAIDASAWTEEERLARVTARYREPFDLARGPLLRVDLYTHAPDAHVLLLTLHHIVCDAESCWTLLEELQTIYAAERRGGRAALPAVPGTYADYVSWQRAMVTGEEGETHWQAWHRQLQGTLPALDLPADRPRPPMQTFNGASEVVVVPAELTARLKALSRAEHVTLYTTLLAAFQVLLHRYTGQQDIIVGSAASGRPGAFARVVGYFVNPVPIRVSFADDPTFASLLAQVRETTVEAIAHQQYPFPLLVERLQPRRDPSRSPVFQADFSLAQPESTYRRRIAAAREAHAGLDVERCDLPEEEGQFDLGAHVTDDGERLSVRFKYNADLFDASTIQRMAASFAALLESVVDEPHASIGALRLLPALERQRLLAAGVGPHVDWPETFVHLMFEARAAESPEATAVEMHVSNGACPRPSLTYRELNRRANRLAHELRRRGVGPDTLAGVCLEPSLDLVVALLAVLKAGGAYVPLDPSYPGERLAFMARDARLEALLTTRSLAARLPELASVPAVWMDESVPATDAADDDNPALATRPEHLAYVIYTSGSTGQPKGAMITHRGLGNYLSWAVDAYRVREGCGAPVSSSIAFDATVTSFFAPLASGRTVVMLPADGMVEALAETLRTAEPFSLVKITPAHLEMLAHLAGGPTAPIAAQRFVIGGEALRDDMLDVWRRLAPHTRLINEYGPTETVVGCSVYEAAEPMPGAVPIGRPIANTTLYVLDARLEPVPAGVLGELYIGGAGVARGYLNRPELTEARFVPDPFSAEPNARLYRTGDLARWRMEGPSASSMPSAARLEFAGRIDAQVKIRGFRIEPGEIEAALATCAEVADCLVVARETANAGKELVAYVVAAAGALDVQALRRDLAARLPEHMIPSAFVSLAAWPLTPNGKIDRTALPAPAARAASRDVAPPRDTLELTLAAVWAEVLGVDRVGLHDDFFELGGHSLLAVRLIARLERALGTTVPLSAILRGPTVEQMARTLRRETSTATASTTIVPIQIGRGPEGAGRGVRVERPPFFCVPGAGGNPVYLHNLAKHLGPEQPFYGLQGAGFDGRRTPHTSVEEMAADYIAAIETIQPEGPYHLGGHSLGGWVAFEMAQQLRRRGREVALVAIIDTPAPSPADHAERASWDDARWIAELTDRIGKLLAPGLALSEERLRPHSAGEQLEIFRQALVAEGAYPREGGTEYLRRTLDVFKAHSQITYAPAANASVPRIVLLRTAEPPHGAAGGGDESWGWGAFGPTTVHVLSGDHLAVLRPPHVAALADCLSSCLAEAVQLAA